MPLMEHKKILDFCMGLVLVPNPGIPRDKTSSLRHINIKKIEYFSPNLNLLEKKGP